MRNKSILHLFIMVFTLIPAVAFCQKIETDSSANVYDLNDFKFRYQRYRALEFDYRMNGSLNKDVGFGAGRLTDDVNLELMFNITADLRGNSFENTEARQKTSSFRASLNTDLNTKKGLSLMSTKHGDLVPEIYLMLDLKPQSENTTETHSAYWRITEI